MAHIVPLKRSDGGTSYKVVHRPKYGSYWSKTFRSEDSAKAALEELERREGASRRAWQTAEKVTVRDVAADWRKRELRFKDTRWSKQQRRWLRVWEREVGGLLLSELTRGVVIETFHRLVAGEVTGRSVSRTTGRHAVAVIRRMLSWALDQGCYGIEHNHLERLRLPKDPPRRRLLTPDEEKALSKAIAAAGGELWSWYLLAVETGMRPSEIERLRWRDVDLERDLIHIGESKTGKPRVLPVTPRLKAELDDLRRSKVVAINRDDEPVVETFPRYAWEKARKASKVDDLRWYDLRHHFARRILAAGKSLKVLQVVMGHSSIQMTADVYGYLENTDALKALLRD